MMKAKTILPIILVIFCSIGLISYFSISHIHSIRKLNESVKEILISYDDSIPFIDLSDKEIMDEQIRKIKRFKAIEGETVRHLPTQIIEEDTKLRSLAESFNEFEDVRVVDPNTEPINKIQSWLMRSIRQYSSNIVLYPYNFKYEHVLENKTKLK